MYLIGDRPTANALDILPIITNPAGGHTVPGRPPRQYRRRAITRPRSFGGT
jgi:hypothetical protein